MYAVLSGARKNLGDYLITARARALLEAHRPEHELVQLPSWESLEGHRDVLDAADAIIILGGPGYQPQMYPKTYPLLTSLDAIKAPVVPLGCGWKGFPGDRASVLSYRFAPQAQELLSTMSRGTRWLGCRDHLTVEVLQRAGIDNAVMTGCPAWYALDKIGTPAPPVDEVRRVVFTPAQLHHYREQSLDVGRVLADLFPAAEKIASFHRGIDGVDAHTPSDDVDNQRALAAGLEQMGFEARDVSGDLERIAFYEDAELHVGYRVHAHIWFLSQRKPSLLLHEDGRGRGLSEAICVPGIDAFRASLSGQLASRLPSARVARRAQKVAAQLGANATAAEEVRRYLEAELVSSFARSAGAGAVIDRTYDVMKRHLASLPG